MTSEIRDVWASNIEKEFEIIRDIVQKYPYISMVRMPRVDSILLSSFYSLLLFCCLYVNRCPADS